MCRKDFNAARAYRKDLDIRRETWTRWCDLLVKDTPNGAFWTLLGCRRSGKTWALEGIREELGRKKTALVDLRNLADIRELHKDARGKKCLLLDEPKQMLATDPGQFLETCADLKEKTRHILLACTPDEWETLRQADKTKTRVRDRDRYFLDPMTAAQWENLSGPGWPLRLTRSLPLEWKQTPFLLELLLSVASKEPRFSNGAPIDNKHLQDLLQQTTAEANTHRFNYIDNVFNDGLSETQQAVLRKIVRGQNLGPDDNSALDLLRQCNIVEKSLADNVRLSNPVLETHLRPPLIIHHLSDLHMGPEEARVVDVKDKSPRGVALGKAAAPGTVREAYTELLKTTRRQPHLLVVSGDFAQTGRKEELQEARRWVDAQTELLNAHPDIDDKHTLLVVEGNHDVDWDHTTGKNGARLRHRNFADCFKGICRPKLEESPETRELTTQPYPDVGLRFILLGSSELGGEVGNDDEFDELMKLAQTLSKSATAALGDDDTKRFNELQEHLNRIDPGLVHHKDISRLGELNGNGFLNILVLHHPVTAMPAAPEIARTAGLINAGAVKNACFNGGIDLVLHGHQHTGWYARERWPERYPNRELHILAAPTLGSTEAMDACGFNEITIYREGTRLAVELRRITFNGAAFDTEAPVIASIEK